MSIHNSLSRQMLPVTTKTTDASVGETNTATGGRQGVDVSACPEARAELGHMVLGAGKEWTERKDVIMFLQDLLNDPAFIKEILAATGLPLAPAAPDSMTASGLTKLLPSGSHPTQYQLDQLRQLLTEKLEHTYPMLDEFRLKGHNSEIMSLELDSSLIQSLKEKIAADDGSVPLLAVAEALQKAVSGTLAIASADKDVQADVTSLKKTLRAQTDALAKAAFTVGEYDKLVKSAAAKDPETRGRTAEALYDAAKEIDRAEKVLDKELGKLLPLSEGEGGAKAMTIQTALVNKKLKLIRENLKAMEHRLRAGQSRMEKKLEDFDKKAFYLVSKATSPGSLQKLEKGMEKAWHDTPALFQDLMRNTANQVRTLSAATKHTLKVIESTVNKGSQALKKAAEAVSEAHTSPMTRLQNEQSGADAAEQKVNTQLRAAYHPLKVAMQKHQNAAEKLLGAAETLVRSSSSHSGPSDAIAATLGEMGDVSGGAALISAAVETSAARAGGAASGKEKQVLSEVQQRERAQRTFNAASAALTEARGEVDSCSDELRATVAQTAEQYGQHQKQLKKLVTFKTEIDKAESHFRKAADRLQRAVQDMTQTAPGSASASREAFNYAATDGKKADYRTRDAVLELSSAVLNATGRPQDIFSKDARIALHLGQFFAQQKQTLLQSVPEFKPWLFDRMVTEIVDKEIPGHFSKTHDPDGKIMLAKVHQAASDAEAGTLLTPKILEEVMEKIPGAAEFLSRAGRSGMVGKVVNASVDRAADRLLSTLPRSFLPSLGLIKATMLPVAYMLALSNLKQAVMPGQAEPKSEKLTLAASFAIQLTKKLVDFAVPHLYRFVADAALTGYDLYRNGPDKFAHNLMKDLVDSGTFAVGSKPFYEGYEQGTDAYFEHQLRTLQAADDKQIAAELENYPEFAREEIATVLKKRQAEENKEIDRLVANYPEEQQKRLTVGLKKQLAAEKAKIQAAQEQSLKGQAAEVQSLTPTETVSRVKRTADTTDIQHDIDTDDPVVMNDIKNKVEDDLKDFTNAAIVRMTDLNIRQAARDHIQNIINSFPADQRGGLDSPDSIMLWRQHRYTEGGYPANLMDILTGSFNYRDKYPEWPEGSSVAFRKALIGNVSPYMDIPRYAKFAGKKIRANLNAKSYGPSMADVFEKTYKKRLSNIKSDYNISLGKMYETSFKTSARDLQQDAKLASFKPELQKFIDGKIKPFVLTLGDHDDNQLSECIALRVGDQLLAWDFMGSYQLIDVSTKGIPYKDQQDWLLNHMNTNARYKYSKPEERERVFATLASPTALAFRRLEGGLGQEMLDRKIAQADKDCDALITTSTEYLIDFVIDALYIGTDIVTGIAAGTLPLGTVGSVMVQIAKSALLTYLKDLTKIHFADNLAAKDAAREAIPANLIASLYVDGSMNIGPELAKKLLAKGNIKLHWVSAAKGINPAKELMLGIPGYHKANEVGSEAAARLAELKTNADHEQIAKTSEVNTKAIPGGTTHRVVEGETIHTITEKYSISSRQLALLIYTNPQIADFDVLSPGDQIFIPYESLLRNHAKVMSFTPVEEIGIQKNEILREITWTPDDVKKLEESIQDGTLLEKVQGKKENHIRYLLTLNYPISKQLIDYVSENIQRQGFDNVRCRAMYIWTGRPNEEEAKVHYVVIGNKYGKDYVFDIGAGKFDVGLGDTILLPTSSWQAKYQDTFSNGHVIYNDFDIDDVRVAVDSYRHRASKKPEQLAGEHVIETEAWLKSQPKKPQNEVQQEKIAEIVKDENGFIYQAEGVTDILTLARELGFSNAHLARLMYNNPAITNDGILHTGSNIFIPDQEVGNHFKDENGKIGVVKLLGSLYRQDAVIRYNMIIPYNRSEELMPLVARAISNIGFDNVYYRAIDIWDSTTDNNPMRHYVVVGEIDGEDYVFDMDAGKLKSTFTGPIILPIKEWTARYAKEFDSKLISINESSDINIVKPRSSGRFSEGLESGTHLINIITSAHEVYYTERDTSPEQLLKKITNNNKTIEDMLKSIQDTHKSLLPVLEKKLILPLGKELEKQGYMNIRYRAVYLWDAKSMETGKPTQHFAVTAIKNNKDFVFDLATRALGDGFKEPLILSQKEWCERYSEMLPDKYIVYRDFNFPKDALESLGKRESSSFEIMGSEKMLTTKTSDEYDFNLLMTELVKKPEINELTNVKEDKSMELMPVLTKELASLNYQNIAYRAVYVWDKSDDNQNMGQPHYIVTASKAGKTLVFDLSTKVYGEGFKGKAISNESDWQQQYKAFFVNKNIAEGYMSKPEDTESAYQLILSTRPEVLLENLMNSDLSIGLYAYTLKDRSDRIIAATGKELTKQNFDNIRYRTVYVWDEKSKNHGKPQSHFVVTATKNNKDFVFDFSNQSLGKGFKEPLILSQKEWAAKYNTLLTRKYITYRDFHSADEAISHSKQRTGNSFDLMPNEKVLQSGDSTYYDFTPLLLDLKKNSTINALMESKEDKSLELIASVTAELKKLKYTDIGYCAVYIWKENDNGDKMMQPHFIVTAKKDGESMVFDLSTAAYGDKFKGEPISNEKSWKTNYNKFFANQTIKIYAMWNPEDAETFSAISVKNLNKMPGTPSVS